MQALRITLFLLAASVPTVAQTEKTPAAPPSRDTASIILAPQPSPLIQLSELPDKMNDRPISPYAGGDTLLGKPGINSGSTSRYILSEITAGLPQFSSSSKASNVVAGGTTNGGKAFAATPGTELLPAFIVRDEKVPSPEQILTYEGRAKIAMDEYLGPSDGLDRGVLNRFTLKQLWMKIPILRALPIEFVGTPARMTNEERAFDAAGANDNLPYPHPPPRVKDGSDE
jgi:hypothetical protein